MVARERGVVGEFTSTPTTEAGSASDAERIIRQRPKAAIALHQLVSPKIALRPDADELIAVECVVDKAIPLNYSNVLMIRIVEVGVGNDLIVLQRDVEGFREQNRACSLYNDAFKANVMTNVRHPLRYTCREISDIRGKPGSRHTVGKRDRSPTHVGNGALKAVYDVVFASGLMVINRYVVSNVEERTLRGVRERDDIRTNRRRVQRMIIACA